MAFFILRQPMFPECPVSGDGPGACVGPRRTRDFLLWPHAGREVGDG